MSGHHGAARSGPADAAKLLNFKLLEECLRDERRIDPRFCPICFQAVPYLLVSNSPDSQTKNHDFWDACMRNVAVCLSADEVAQHKSALQRNIDHCTRRGAHDTIMKTCGKEHITNPLEIFRTLLCICLVNCLYAVDTSSGNARGVLNRAHNPRKRFRSGNGAWPTSVSQLFPYGPQCTIRPLVMSFLFLADDSPLLVLNAILQLARPRVWDVIIGTGLHQFLLEALLRIIVHEINDVVEVQVAVDNQKLSLPPLRDAAWLRNGRALHACSEFLHTVMTGPYARPDDILRFLAPAAAFRELFTLTMDLCHIPGPRQEDWKLVVTSLFPVSDQAARARELVSDDDVLRTVDKTPRTLVLIAAIYSAFWSYSRRCAGSDCTRTVLDHEGDSDSPVQLPVCGTCKIMRYCYKSCQRSDWSHAQVPHKRLCAVFAAMQAVADFSHTEGREYARLLRESSIPDVSLALAARWALSSGKCYMDNVRGEIAVSKLSCISPDDNDAAKFPGMFL